MLRPIKNTLNRVRMMGIVATVTSSPSATASVGNPDLTSISRSAQGQATLVPKIGGALTPIILGSAGAATGNSAFVGIESSTTKSSYVATVYDTASTGDDGTFNLICLNYTSAFDGRGSLQEVVSSFNRPRFLPLKFNGVLTTPIVTAGARQASITKIDVAGDYLITLRSGFSKVPAVVVAINGATIAGYRITSQTNKTINVQTFDASGTLTDANFDMWILGQDTAVEVGLYGRNAVMTPNRKCRILGLQVSNNAGAYTISRNDEDATIEDLGTGNFRITYQKPSQREPVIVCNGIGGAFRCQTVAHTSTSVGGKTFFTKSEFKVTNAAGTVQDQSAMVGIALFDDPFNY